MVKFDELVNYIQEWEQKVSLDDLGKRKDDSGKQSFAIIKEFLNGLSLEQLAETAFTIKNFLGLLEAYTSKLNKLKDVIHGITCDVMDDQGIEKFATDFGTVSRSSKLFANIDKEHFNDLIKWITDKGYFQVLRQQLNPKPVQELIADEGVNFPHTELTTKASLRLTPKKS